MFPHISVCDPLDGPIFGLMGIIQINGKGPLIDAAYQVLRL